MAAMLHILAYSLYKAYAFLSSRSVIAERAATLGIPAPNRSVAWSKLAIVGSIIVAPRSVTRNANLDACFLAQLRLQARQGWQYFGNDHGWTDDRKRCAYKQPGKVNENCTQLAKQVSTTFIIITVGGTAHTARNAKSPLFPGDRPGLAIADCDGKVRTIGSSMHAQFTNLNEANRLS